MAKESIAKITTALARPIAEKQGVRLWDVSFEKEGSNWYLRVYLDGNERPVTIQDCEAVSRPLSELLDQEDPISHSYFLEVSSAGLGRRLRKEEHLLASVGESVVVRLIRPVNGIREFFGRISSVNKTEFTLETQEGTHQFSLSECAYVKWADDLDLSF